MWRGQVCSCGSDRRLYHARNNNSEPWKPAASEPVVAWSLHKGCSDPAELNTVSLDVILLWKHSNQCESCCRRGHHDNQQPVVDRIGSPLYPHPPTTHSALSGKEPDSGNSSIWCPLGRRESTWLAHPSYGSPEAFCAVLEGVKVLWVIALPKIASWK